MCAWCPRRVTWSLQLHDKADEDERERKHLAERAQRRTVDAFHALLRQLNAPVIAPDTPWAAVQPRVSSEAAYLALDAAEAQRLFDVFTQQLAVKRVTSRRL